MLWPDCNSCGQRLQLRRSLLLAITPNMRQLFLRFRIVALLIASLSQSQTDGSTFIQGQLQTNDNVVTLTPDSDRFNLKITNPEAVRGEKNRTIILHGVPMKDGIRVISFATIDDHDKPEDFSFAAIVAERKDADMVEHLLQLGANPNAKTREGIPALVAAMHMADSSLIGNGIDPNIDITTLLIDHGADPNALNKNWQTPLMAAAFLGDEKLVNLFVKHKANVNIGNKFGMTALMYARGAAALRLLIAAGASINDRNITGETALYYATQRANPDEVMALIEAGASVNAKNDKNMSPLHLAQLELASDRFSKRGLGPDEHERRVQSVIDLLLAAGALPDPQ